MTIYTALHEIRKSLQSDDNRAWDALDVIGRAVTAREALVKALETMTDHAEEVYPHFESERGRRDIKQARAALAQARGE